ncbi:MAG: UvrD-helicase domain-containing protein [Syntrophorhabdaceae bacterium]|nr:UvrD-helicase domain-containing protein [Syntrophorhabdaceae bacterium]
MPSQENPGPFIFFLSIIVIFLILIALSWIVIKEKKRITKKKIDFINSLKDKIYSATQDFNILLSHNCYFNHRKLENWNNVYAAVAQQVTFPYKKLDITPALKNNLNHFLNNYKNGEQIRQNHNHKFCQYELLKNQMLFDSVESYPLTEKQREAIVYDEDSNLVIAGAGTGKTTTIVGKVAYLIKTLNVNPSEILLLAFTRRAAEEMRERIERRVGVNLDVMTFHKFGLDILSRVERTKPSVFDEENRLPKIINDKLDELKRDPVYFNLLTRYLAYYLKPYKAPHDFETKDKYLQYLKSNNIRTLKGETVKSYEEAEIANFFYVNNIDYEYERPYEHATATYNHSQYCPDFYLSDYGIYIEHFGIDRNGDVPKWFEGPNPKEKYNNGIIWKRQIHGRYKTTLVETFHYEKKEGILFDNLEKNLRQHGVAFAPKSDNDIYNIFDKQEAIPLLVNLIQTFLNLFKANNFTIDDLIAKARVMDGTGRYAAFLKIFQPIYDAHEQFLRDAGEIDFNDMITKATRYINTNQYRSPYRYILIDEFQDISMGRYNLIKALIGQNPQQRLFCVGDDWQSIYRFTGSDLSIFTDFEKYFGYTQRTFLDYTFRFNDKIAQFTSEFIQQNPAQLKKELKTKYSTTEKPYKIIFKDTDADLKRLMSCLKNIKEKTNNDPAKVFILGRYNFNSPSRRDLSYLSKTFDPLQIEFLTAHSAKGLEADYVIIDYLNSEKYGFPTEIVDDPIINMVLAESDNYDHAEERRLFYVASTRAKHKVYLLPNTFKPSMFVLELLQKDPKQLECEKCGGVLTIRVNRTTNNRFLGCTNYPYCDFTQPLGRRFTNRST